MEERVVLVTGAGRGIGAATARLMAEQGYRVAAVDWCVGDQVPVHVPYSMPTVAELEAVAQGSDGRIVAHVADVRDRAALAAVVADAIERWGRVDAAVAAAAVMLGGTALWETPDDDLNLLWDINVRGVWNTAAVTVPAMLNGPDPEGGRFVAVASAAAEHGLYRLAGYNAVKHAVAGLIKGLAADLIGSGVTAAAVSPGSTDTVMLEATGALYGVEDVSSFALRQLIGRLLEPAEVAAALAFCCSREGSVFNGSVLSADGGFSA